jgi:N-dimethylarginine dimethylaminohydrolase
MDIPVNITKAHTQYSDLIEILLQFGIKIKFIPEKCWLVDMVFAANAGFINDRTFIMSNFTAVPRRQETQIYESYFKENYDIVVPYNKFEGAGDALFSHNKKILWMGFGFRTTKEAMHEIPFHNISIQSLCLVDPRFYHLDTCFCPMEDYVMVYLPAFTQESQDIIKRAFEGKVISVDEEDAVNFACNSFYISEKAYVIGHKYSDKLKNELTFIGIVPLETNMSEFLKSGGSVKCCILH